MTLSDTDLIDRAEITDALVAYCHAQDQNEWALYEAVFTPDATVAFAGMNMPDMTAAALRDFLVKHNETRISGQHLVGNTLFELDGDRARVVSEVIYITLHPTAAAADLVKRVRGNALYVDAFVRSANGWRIRHRSIAQKNVEIDEGNYDPALLAAIRQGAETRWFQTQPAITA